MLWPVKYKIIIINAIYLYFLNTYNIYYYYIYNVINIIIIEFRNYLPIVIMFIIDNIMLIDNVKL